MEQLQRARDILNSIYEARAVRGSGGMEARGGVKGKAKNFGKYNRSGTKKYKTTGKKKGISSQQRSAQAMERNRRNMPKVKSKKQTTGGDIVPYNKEKGMRKTTTDIVLFKKPVPRPEGKGMRKTTTDIVPINKPKPRAPGRTRPSLPQGRGGEIVPVPRPIPKPSPKSTPKPSTGSVREPVKNAVQVYRGGGEMEVYKDKKKDPVKQRPKRQSREDKLLKRFSKTTERSFAPVRTPSYRGRSVGIDFLDPDDLSI